jgi:TPR repeat protein
VRRAEGLIVNGEIEAGRALLQRAAELGSGRAALKLGRSYDPAQARPLNFADRQSNPALAKAWYERALALGTQEAAEYLGPSQGK